MVLAFKLMSRVFSGLFNFSSSRPKMYCTNWTGSQTPRPTPSRIHRADPAAPSEHASATTRRFPIWGWAFHLAHSRPATRRFFACFDCFFGGFLVFFFRLFFPKKLFARDRLARAFTKRVNLTTPNIILTAPSAQPPTQPTAS